MNRSTINSKDIKATQEIIFRAFTDPVALAVWLAPGEMTGKVHNFECCVGGGYEMSLFYPANKNEMPGKTSRKEDRFISRFIELTPFSKIIQAINFVSDNPAFSGEMMMDVCLEQKQVYTKVTIEFTNIPNGISLRDNKNGTALSLEKLARYVE